MPALSFHQRAAPVRLLGIGLSVDGWRKPWEEMIEPMRCRLILRSIILWLLKRDFNFDLYIYDDGTTISLIFREQPFLQEAVDVSVLGMVPH